MVLVVFIGDIFERGGGACRKPCLWLMIIMVDVAQPGTGGVGGGVMEWRLLQTG